MILLSIHIPTTPDRDASYALLEEEIRNQCLALKEEPIESWPQMGLNPGGWRSKRIEFLYCKDNKEISIGAKRDILYKASTGLYSWQVDSDDFIAPKAISKIFMKGLDMGFEHPDCVTFEERVTIDGIEQRSNFSLKYDDWAENVDGFDYVRTPFFKTPILTELCQKTGVADMRFGEDHDFARRIKPLLRFEAHIPEQLYYYQHTSSEHNERYGITKTNKFDFSDSGKLAAMEYLKSIGKYEQVISQPYPTTVAKSDMVVEAANRYYNKHHEIS